MSDTHPEDDWPEQRRALGRIVSKRGVDEVADEIPTDRATVYRLIRGETTNPHRATRYGVQRVIDAHEDQ